MAHGLWRYRFMIVLAASGLLAAALMVSAGCGKADQPSAVEEQEEYAGEAEDTQDPEEAVSKEEWDEQEERKREKEAELQQKEEGVREERGEEGRIGDPPSDEDDDF